MWLSAARFGETLRQAVLGLQSITEGSLAAAGCSARTSISSHCLGILLQCKPSLGKVLKQVAKCQLQCLLKTNLLTFECFSENLNTSTLPRSILQVLPVLSAACWFPPTPSWVKVACDLSSLDANKSPFGNRRHKTLPASLVWGGWLHLAALVIVYVCTT